MSMEGTGRAGAIGAPGGGAAGGAGDPPRRTRRGPRPAPRPDWVRALNGIGDPAWIPLDADGLLEEASRRTGLDDFGDAAFREPMAIFLDALEREARLHLIGRVLARADVLNWLGNRLQLVDWRKRHPEIDAERIDAPIFITGLPRTGTSILHDLLAQDPANRVPLAWEVLHPCPPPEAASYATDPRIAAADPAIRIWDHVVPEYRTMHELGARLPVECIVMTAHEFRSDELSGRHVVPSYAAWLARADLRPAYAFHRRMLQHLQWRCPGERWVLKAPSHLGALESLLAVYPDARIVWTHRDPLTVMASVASILFHTAWVRSDAVDPEQVLDWFTGETCLSLLEGASRVRDADPRGSRRFFDVRYEDLMADPLGTIGALYAHFGIGLSDDAGARMRATLAARPKGVHGAHRYRFEDTGLDPAAERARFAAYRERYRVAAEV